METGLVFTPFLPGDSLLFAAGAFAALKSLNIFVLWIVLLLAAFIGNSSNYWIGYFAGKKIIAHPRIPIDEEHIKETKRFFDKYGGKTIIIARFMPFVRTFAPFVAGVSKMSYKKFLSYDLIGGFSWVTVGTMAGYFFGNIGVVKKNFSLVIIALVVISLMPIIFKIISRTLIKKK
jgi:membrane-associated protein